MDCSHRHGLLKFDYHSSEESETNSMLHNGLLDLMNRSTCFWHYYAHYQELATIHPSNRTLQKPTAMHPTSNLP